MKKPDLAWLNSAKEKLLPLLRRYRALLIVLLAGVLLLASGGLSRRRTARTNGCTGRCGKRRRGIFPVRV